MLVLPDPTVLAPLLAPYGGSTEIDRHRRAHYAAMAVKSQLNHGEHDWAPTTRPTSGRSASTTTSWHWPPASSGRAGSRRCGAGRFRSRCTDFACLHDRGIPLGVVSNASGQIADTLCRGGICQVGDGAGVIVRCVVDSHLVGVAKPDPAIFEHAAREFGGIERSRIVYVGDSVTIDVAAATAAGLRPVLLDPFDDHVGAPFERIHVIGDLLG